MFPFNANIFTGKTTLIKALTGDAKMQPDNKLFATLDVTAHAGKLPSGIHALFVDTVGFISDLPPELVESFSATLEDVVVSVKSVVAITFILREYFVINLLFYIVIWEAIGKSS